MDRFLTAILRSHHETTGRNPDELHAYSTGDGLVRRAGRRGICPSGSPSVGWGCRAFWRGPFLRRWFCDDFAALALRRRTKDAAEGNGKRKQREDGEPECSNQKSSASSICKSYTHYLCG